MECRARDGREQLAALSRSAATEGQSARGPLGRPHEERRRGGHLGTEQTPPLLSQSAHRRDRLPAKLQPDTLTQAHPQFARPRLRRTHSSLGALMRASAAADRIARDAGAAFVGRQRLRSRSRFLASALSCR